MWRAISGGFHSTIFFIEKPLLLLAKFAITIYNYGVFDSIRSEKKGVIPKILRMLKG